ncbi:hypothetical protein A3F60_03375 [Candidatus Roizmanbacteria bacterium RIFCSPHIGHO2_12_FULL_39_8]|uniref:EamA domain-containing protein n=1 Tax=Candidatus Roizmanbacteria bacterium RIFCSPHIGHO2_12_FULL_39_8 TaxID=1802050 RepID=A0A1F7I3W3_9BACT|nr:MAG: hypothetical protein A3F60_03375 [Candidatus Roizmanbacteria bacterium RIFCSPHIGHO2_12_FULL_39_8]
MKQINKGILLAFTASVISGIAIFYSKLSVAQIPPLVLTTGRNTYVAVLFLFLILFSGKIKEVKKLTRGQVIRLTLIGLIGGAVPFYLFFSGLSYISAIQANLIQKSLFIWVSLLALIFLKEKLNKVYLVAFILIAAANFYFAKIDFSIGKGELMVLAATLLWSFETVIAKKTIKHVSTELVGFFRMGIGSILLLVTSFATGNISTLLAINASQMIIIFVGGTILFFYVFSWYKGLKYAPASLVTLILTFAVVVGNVLNGSFAGVKLMPKDIYSSILTILAVVILFVFNFCVKLKPQISKIKT